MLDIGLKRIAKGVILATLQFLTSCVGSLVKPDFDRISVGMNKGQVISTLGKPDETSATSGTEYLKYGWDNPFDGIVGPVEWYFVRFVNGKVDSYGKVGDFDSTKDPTININQKVINR